MITTQSDIVRFQQHCDKVIAEQHPKMADKAKGTFISALNISSDVGVALGKSEHAWDLSVDRSGVSWCSLS